MPVLGEIVVEVHHKGQRKQLPLVVVKGYGETLVGRNWLTTMKLDWKKNFQLKSAKCTEIESLLQSYKEVFKEEKGSIKSHYASLHIREAQPKFCKARPIPKKQWVQNWTNLKPVE